MSKFSKLITNAQKELDEVKKKVVAGEILSHEEASLLQEFEQSVKALRLWIIRTEASSTIPHKDIAARWGISGARVSQIKSRGK